MTASTIFRVRRSESDGKRYAARDRAGNTSFRDRCEHAVWVDGRVEWRVHPEGGVMSPFEGPDEVWDQLADA